jgi:hypothetical protein
VTGALPSGCCLVRPPDAKTLFDAGNGGWRTPESAFETFRVAFGADLPEMEYRSLSDGFRRVHQISLQGWLIARQKLIDTQPLLGLLTKARVVRSQEVGARRHRLVVQTAGRRFVVDLVREDEFQIYAGGVFIADGSLDFGSAVHVSDAPAGKRVSAEVFVPDADLVGVDLSILSVLRVEQVWKIDGFGEEPAAP